MSSSSAIETQLPPSPDLSPTPPRLPASPLTLRATSIMQHRPPATSVSPLTMANYADSSTSGSLACHRHLGALAAGAHGLAIFSLDQIQQPLLWLNHPSLARYETSVLAFAPTPETTTIPGATSTKTSSSHHPLFLASTRGTGVLVWDVSGQSQSPLWGRLGMISETVSSPLTSLAWHNSHTLGAATGSTAAMWDLRTSPYQVPPTLRLGVRHKGAAPYVQVAFCGNECALLDALGMLRIYDVRLLGGSGAITHRGTSSLTHHQNQALNSFSAFTHAGVGLVAHQEGSWVTWGLDNIGSDAVVKVWKRDESQVQSTVNHPDPDDYWDPNPSPSSSGIISQHVLGSSSTTAAAASYSLVGKCSMPGLACARVADNQQLVTVSIPQSEPTTTNTLRWNSTVWNVTPEGLQETARFYSNSADWQQNLMMGNADVGSMCAAELGWFPEEDPRLTLCSLTDKSFLACYRLADIQAEALIEAPESATKQASPSRNERVLTLKSTRLFPSEVESTIGDAARVWHKSGLDEWEKPKRNEIEREASGTGEPPFEMDMTPSTSFAGLLTGGGAGVGNEFKNIPVPNLMGDSNEKQKLDADRRDTVELMKNIDTDRIPCPRLCGMVFGGGVGGIAIFHNGDIRKVSKWWGTNNLSKRSAVPGLIGEPAPTENPRLQAQEQDPLAGDVVALDYPRSLKDLTEMTAAAKEAQWGETDDDDGTSDALPLAGENIFEDESDASSDSGEEDHQDDFLANQRGRDSKDLYSHYFGVYRRPTIEPPDVNGSNDSSEEHDGTPSDVLAPFVKVTFEYDRLALNGQSMELARRWKLGRCSSLALATSTPTEETGAKTRIFEQQSSPTKTYGTRPSIPSKMAKYPDEERGVHGGEFSVRPNVQESMVFLRKLFTHQRDGVGASKVLSPSGGLVATKAIGVQNVPGESATKHRNETHLVKPAALGVYTLRKMSATTKVNTELQHMKATCDYNAHVCRDVGESEKNEVWKLIGQLVEMRLNATNPTRFDGWGQFGGTAFCVSLIENLLRYYDSLGDVQMLSAMVCVLRGNRTEDISRLLLPKGKDASYDFYIRKYADLLYGWNLLTIRAEVLKHLINSVSSYDYGRNRLVLQEDEDPSEPMVGLAFTCPRCEGGTDLGTNFCRSCQDFAFRCIICDNAVRGLFTVCKSCNHGGHLSCITKWFATMDVCPSGCGCKCLQATSGAHSDRSFAPALELPVMSE